MRSDSFVTPRPSPFRYVKLYHALGDSLTATRSPKAGQDDNSVAAPWRNLLAERVPSGARPGRLPLVAPRESARHRLDAPPHLGQPLGSGAVLGRGDVVSHRAWPSSSPCPRTNAL